MKNFLLIILLSSSFIYSQIELPVPVEVRNAYDKNTRSADGKPGINYWQNSASYVINADINDLTGELKGSAVIIYKNNSPYELKNIFMRAYQNINRSDTRKDWRFDPAGFDSGLVIKKLAVNGTAVSMNSYDEFEDRGTNLIIKKTDIAPGGMAEIEVEWEFHVPIINALRMGNYIENNYFIAYWYPQIAVYDDIDGWDNTEYAGMVEFYNDFNDYDVNITVPSEYNLWATGELLNPDDVMKGDVREKFDKANRSSDLIHIIEKDDIGKIVFSNNIKTYHFKADNVTDFAFCMSKNYLWDGKTINIDGRKVFVSVMYSASEPGMNELCDIAAKSLKLYSIVLPAVPYPYPALTIFNGEGGMEYPMMVNQGGGEERVWMIQTTAHEIAHMYFPFYMGTNERKYAWMDEGWAEMLSEYVIWDMDTTIDFKARDMKRYLDVAGTMKDQPLMIPSRDYNQGDQYYNSAYFKSSVMYNMLRDAIGTDVFNAALKEYMRRWNGKHPMPYDFFNSFNDAAGTDLNWFWKPWCFEISYPDIAIKKVNAENGKINITIENKGGLPLPADIYFIYEGKPEVHHISASIWSDGQKEKTISFDLNGNLKSVIIGSQYIPDIDGVNNEWNK